MVNNITDIFLQKWNLKDIKNDKRNLLKLWGNAHCEENHGIIQPYIYVSGYDRSIQPLHIEDEGFSSVNILHEGCEVLWTVVPADAMKKLEKAIFKYYWGPLEEIPLKRFQWLKRYITEELRHKNMFVTEDFLKKYHIPRKTFKQYAGEMVVGKEY